MPGFPFLKLSSSEFAKCSTPRWAYSAAVLWMSEWVSEQYLGVKKRWVNFLVAPAARVMFWNSSITIVGFVNHQAAPIFIGTLENQITKHLFLQSFIETIALLYSVLLIDTEGGKRTQIQENSPGEQARPPAASARLRCVLGLCPTQRLSSWL